MKINPLKAGLALLVACLLGTGFSQGYTHNPFFEDTSRHSHNWGVVSLDIGLYVFENVETDDMDIYDEAVELMEDALRAVQARLHEADAELHEQRDDVIEELEDAVEDGEDFSDLVPEARALVDQATELLADPELDEDPVALGALLSRLLLAEGGVAEGWEELFDDDIGEYVVGWAALQFVWPIWEQMEQFATENQIFEVRDSLDYIADELLVDYVPREDWRMYDEEAGEAAAHRIVSYLETIADATLFPDRDLGAVAALTEDLTVQACEAYAAGDELLGGEIAVQGYYFFDEHLRKMIDLFDPDLMPVIRSDYKDLRKSGDTELCERLTENMGTARTLLGG